MDAFTRLIHELGKLPGVGQKSATRLAYHILNTKDESAGLLADAIRDAKRDTAYCSTCFTYTEGNECNICRSTSRNGALVAVVERPCDVDAIEATGNYNGKFHVLHGILSPVNGIGAEQLKVKELVHRMAALVEEHGEGNAEVILALNPSVEGETTGLYISRLLQSLGVKISKIAYGLPMGGALEYADRMTIAKAIDNRTSI